MSSGSGSGSDFWSSFIIIRYLFIKIIENTGFLSEMGMEIICLILVIDHLLKFMEADFNFFLFKETDLSGIVIVSILKDAKKRFWF